MYMKNVFVDHGRCIPSKLFLSVKQVGSLGSYNITTCLVTKMQLSVHENTNLKEKNLPNLKPSIHPSVHRMRSPVPPSIVERIRPPTVGEYM